MIPKRPMPIEWAELYDGRSSDSFHIMDGCAICSHYHRLVYNEYIDEWCDLHEFAIAGGRCDDFENRTMFHEMDRMSIFPDRYVDLVNMV